MAWVLRASISISLVRSACAMAKKILVVEDEPGIQELLQLNLSMAGYEVIQAYDADQAMARMRVTTPDLVMIDWNMPGHPGVWFVKHLRGDELRGGIPVIMLTARDDEQDKVLAFECGVDDYVTKPFKTRELLARVQALLRRSTQHAEQIVLDIDGLRLNHATRQVRAGRADLNLGPTEYKLLHFLMSNPQRVHTRAQLLNHVWGTSAELQERTVDVYVGRLRGLLENQGHHECIETVRSVGYRFLKLCDGLKPSAAPEFDVAAPTWMN
jgi:two-component system phosphate regulon response regulator PhoB